MSVVIVQVDICGQDSIALRFVCFERSVTPQCRSHLTKHFHSLHTHRQVRFVTLREQRCNSLQRCVEKGRVQRISRCLFHNGFRSFNLRESFVLSEPKTGHATERRAKTESSLCQSLIVFVDRKVLFQARLQCRDFDRSRLCSKDTHGRVDV